MEEKKSIKISVITILLIIVIAILTGYIYIEKRNSENKISSLEKDTKIMQDTIKDLQEKISQSTTVSTTDKNIDEKNNNREVQFSNTEIKKAISDYLNIFVAWGDTYEILYDLGLMKKNEYSDVAVTADNYKKTNIKYSDFENAIEKYMTKEWFNTYNGDEKSWFWFKNVDGLLYYYDSGLTGTEYVIEKVESKGDYSDKSYIATGYSENVDGSKNEETIEFQIENNNGKCVISYCGF